MARRERFDLPTAWIAARYEHLTYFINLSLAVLYHPMPYLSADEVGRSLQRYGIDYCGYSVFTYTSTIREPSHT